MDELLMSLETVGEAENLATQLKQTLSRGLQKTRLSNRRQKCLTAISIRRGIHRNLACEEISIQPKNGPNAQKEWTQRKLLSNVSF